MGKMKRVCHRPEIHSCVVDDHCDIVPFALEFQRLCMGLGMEQLQALTVHVDAHPDLSIPSSTISQSTTDWTDIEKLYDILLEEEGGIAEFIIPLVFHRIFSQVVWVRSSWATQFPDGTCSFQLSRYPIKTNYVTPYYLDENVCSDNESLFTDPACDIHLTTCLPTDTIHWKVLDPNRQISFPSYEKNAIIYEHLHQPQYWILDICLDYFSTQNPFLQEIMQLLKEDSQWKDSDISDMIEAIKWTLVSIKYRVNPDIDNPQENLQEKYSESLRAWQSAFLSSSIEGSEQLLWNSIGCSISDSHVPENVRHFISSQFHLLSLPLKQKIGDYKHLLLLPHNLVRDKALIDAKVMELKEFIRKILSKIKAPPLFISIARSVEDGYTDSNIADDLQQRVLSMTKDVILEELGTDFVIINHDLTEECIEGAFTLFHSPDTRKSLRESVDFINRTYYK